MKNIQKTLLILLAILLYNLSYSQKNNLKIFDPFIGNWIGHYINSEDSTLLHEVQWGYGIDSNYVLKLKEVPEMNFIMETYYFWDYEAKQISSISFLNRNMISKGKIKIKNGKLEIYESTFFDSGSSNSYSTFEINKAGELEDYYFRNRNEKMIQGHFILYRRK